MNLQGRPMEPGDIPLLQEAVAALNSPFSEFCAANLYLFREVHNYRLIRQPLLGVVGRTYDGLEHFTPLAEVPAGDLPSLAREVGRAIYPVAADDLAGAPANCNADDSDYVFEAAAIAAYSGAARKAKRQISARFRAACDPRDEPFEARHAAHALAVLDGWLSDVQRPWAETDYRACREALELLGPLRLSGLMIYTEAGQPAGFLLASARNGSAVVHFAKGRRDLPGVFEHMFSRFAEINAERFSLLNFEQDLGKPGFRQAKRAYGPSLMLHKHRLHQPAS